MSSIALLLVCKLLYYYVFRIVLKADTCTNKLKKMNRVFSLNLHTFKIIILYLRFQHCEDRGEDTEVKFYATESRPIY